MATLYTNNMGQNYRQGTLNVVQDDVTLSQFLTWGFLGIQISGTWTGTITFEGTVDGTNWVALPVTPIAGGATVTTATGNGIWFVQNTGFAAVRARSSTFTSGNPVVSIRSLPGQA